MSPFPTVTEAQTHLRRLQVAAAQGTLELHPYLDPSGKHAFTLIDRLRTTPAGHPALGADLAEGCAEEVESPADAAPAEPGEMVAAAARRYPSTYDRNAAGHTVLRLLAAGEVPAYLSDPPTFPNPRGVAMSTHQIQASLSPGSSAGMPRPVGR